MTARLTAKQENQVGVLEVKNRDLVEWELKGRDGKHEREVVASLVHSGAGLGACLQTHAP